MIERKWIEKSLRLLEKVLFELKNGDEKRREVKRIRGNGSFYMELLESGDVVKRGNMTVGDVQRRQMKATAIFFLRKRSRLYLVHLTILFLEA